MKHLAKILICAFCGLSAGPVSAYSLYLYSKALVRTDTVRLRDIARVQGEDGPGVVADKVVVRGLKKPFYISRKQLETRLKNGPEKLDWVYGSGVWIVPLTRKMTNADLERLFRNQVKQITGGTEYLKNAHIEFQTRKGVLHVPAAGRLKFTLPRSTKFLRPGPRRISLSIGVARKNGRFRVLHRYHVPMKIMRRIRAAVATRGLRPGARLAPGDWKVKEILTDDDAARYVHRNLRGRRVMTRIGAGGLLTDSNVRESPDVRRGQMVSLILQKPGFVLKAQAHAQRKGNVGDIVPVRVILPSGGYAKSVKARVVGQGLTVLHEKRTVREKNTTPRRQKTVTGK